MLSPPTKRLAASPSGVIASFTVEAAGLMGVLADEALRYCGYVVGVVPQFLKDHEVAHQGLQELIVTQSMHERKAIMAIDPMRSSLSLAASAVWMSCSRY
ncbi:MAG: LOG family protein [Pirellulales bacterium]